MSWNFGHITGTGTIRLPVIDGMVVKEESKVAAPFSVTTGMVGGGLYNRNSAPQMSAIDHVMPWLEDGMPLIAPLGRF